MSGDRRCARSKRPMLAMPVLGDVEPARNPYALACGDVVEKTRQSRRASRPACQPAMQPARQHLGGAPAPGIEQVERVLEIGEESLAGAEALGVDEAQVVDVERI